MPAQRRLAFITNGAYVLVLGLGASSFELGDEHRDGFQQVEQFEATHHGSRTERHSARADANRPADTSRRLVRWC